MPEKGFDLFIRWDIWFESYAAHFFQNLFKLWKTNGRLISYVIDQLLYLHCRDEIRKDKCLFAKLLELWYSDLIRSCRHMSLKDLLKLCFVLLEHVSKLCELWSHTIKIFLCWTCTLQFREIVSLPSRAFVKQTYW